MKKSRLRSSGIKNEFLSTEFIENTLGKKISTDRYNPFDADKFLLSIDDIMKLDENGYIDRENNDQSKLELVVKRALLRLKKIEREVVVRYYFQGHTLSKIAEELGDEKGRIYSILTNSVDKLKSLIVEEKHQIGLTADLNQCVLCRSSDAKGINEYIHLWVDSGNMKKKDPLKGIISELYKRYTINDDFTIEDVITHIYYHMGIDDKSVLGSSDRNRYEQSDTIQTNLALPKELREEIDEISSKYGITKSFIIRMSLSYGLRWVRFMLFNSDRMFLDQLYISQLVKRLVV